MWQRFIFWQTQIAKNVVAAFIYSTMKSPFGFSYYYKRVRRQCRPCEGPCRIHPDLCHEVCPGYNFMAAYTSPKPCTLSTSQPEPSTHAVSTSTPAVNFVAVFLISEISILTIISLVALITHSYNDLTKQVAQKECCGNQECQQFEKAVVDMDAEKLKTCLCTKKLCVLKFDSVLTGLLQQQDKTKLKLIMLMLRHLCEDIKDREQCNAVKVYPTYTEGKRWKPVIVLLENKLSDQTEDTYRNWPVVRRRFDLVSTEAADVMNSEKAKACTMNFKKMVAISESISEHELASHNSNITHVSVCTCKKKDGKIEKEDCIVVYCLLKGYIPFSENPVPSKLKTKDYGNVPVDVREGFCTVCMHNGANETHNNPQHHESKMATSFNRELLMGAEISSLCEGGPNSRHVGTLGAFAKRRDGTFGLLTCSHVVNPAHKKLVDMQPDEKQIVQPGLCSDHYDAANGLDTCERTRICGKILSCKMNGGSKDQIGVDVAFAEVTDRHPKAVDFVFIRPQQLAALRSPLKFDGSFIHSTNLQKEHFNMGVIKVGRTTGLTRGKLIYHKSQPLIEKNIEFPNGTDLFPKVTELFHGQLEVQSLTDSFADQGDSGSFVFLQHPDGSLVCLGMLIATMSYNTAIVTPINAVLEAVSTDWLGNAEILPLSTFSNSSNINESDPEQAHLLNLPIPVNLPIPSSPNLTANQETENSVSEYPPLSSTSFEEDMEHSGLNDTELHLDLSVEASSGSRSRKDKRHEPADRSSDGSEHTDNLMQLPATTNSSDGQPCETVINIEGGSEKQEKELPEQNPFLVTGEVKGEDRQNLRVVRRKLKPRCSRQ